MKKRKICIVILVLMMICNVVFINELNVKADTLTSEYAKGISVGFTSMGDISTLDFAVTEEYFVVEQNMLFHKDTNYRIELSNSIFKVYENGQLKWSINTDFTLQPLSTDGFIQFTKEGYKRIFAGSMTFKKKGVYFIPINTLAVEEYVKGVLPFEVYESFPIEALKAQAVAARTYALANKGNYISAGYDLRDDVNSQVYRGFVQGTTNCNLAVEATKGQVLTYQGNLINALFSSSNGGYSERAENVWNASYPYTIDAKDPFDTYEQWVEEKTIPQLDTLLKDKHKELNVKEFINLDLGNIKTFPSGRVSEISIQYLDAMNTQKSLTLTKGETRSFFNFKSALYTVKFENGKYIFTGSGYGHGVGMSQWGAYARAKGGQEYVEILNFYYKNTTLQTLQGSKIVTLKSRIGGINRYETAVQIAEKLYNGQIENVVVASGENFPDALSGAVLAKKVNGPILLLNKTVDSSSETLNYIKEKVNKAGKIYILGGAGAISQEFIEFFKSCGFKEENLIRFAGQDRKETSLLISKEVNAPKGTPIVIASGATFPDALTIAPIAAKMGWPILLVDQNTIEQTLESYLVENTPQRVYIVGGNGVVSENSRLRIKNILGTSDENIIRLGGKNRYETSRIINSTFVQNPSEIVMTSGTNFPDSLTGSLYAVMNNAPIVLSDENGTKEAEGYVKFVGINRSDKNPIPLTVLGLQGAVSDESVAYFTRIIE